MIPGKSFPDEDLEAIPSTSTPNGAVYVLGDDLWVDSSALIRTAVVGAAPFRQRLTRRLRQLRIYATQVNEVKALGRAIGSTRT